MSATTKKQRHVGAHVHFSMVADIERKVEESSVSVVASCGTDDVAVSNCGFDVKSRNIFLKVKKQHEARVMLEACAIVSRLFEACLSRHRAMIVHCHGNASNLTHYAIPSHFGFIVHQRTTSL